MKNFYTRKLITPLLMAFLAACPTLLQAQIYKVSLTNYQACGGATLIPFCYYSTQTFTGVTIYYERLVAADTWQLEGTQVFNNKTSYVMYNGDDLSAPTTFRVRALDESTGAIYISNSVSVNPATWGNGRGTAQSIATAYWGTTCSGKNFIDVANYYTTQGRPPFQIAYKKNTDADFTSAGETVNSFAISGIEAGVNYTVRVTDKCGSVAYTSTYLAMTAGYEINQPPTTCSNGKVTINASGDNRYQGVPPYQYGILKAGGSNTDTGFTSSNVFSGLSPATYKYFVKDACGHLSADATFSLGGGIPGGTLTYAPVATDSCLLNITLHANANSGTKPYRYGLSSNNNPNFVYQQDSVFTVSQSTPLDYYHYQIINACGDTSVTANEFVRVSFPGIDSVISLSNNCMRSVVVHVSGGYGPYEYLWYPDSLGFAIYGKSDTIKLPPTVNWVQARDRCGHETFVYIPATACTLVTTPGSFESVNSAQGCPNLSGNSWIDVHDDNGNLVYSVNPNNNNLGSVCWGVNVQQNNGSLRSDTMLGSPFYFLDRNFYIEPPANLVLTDSVSIRLYFTAQEVSDMVNYLGSLGIWSTEYDLKILKKKGSATSPVDLNVVNDIMAADSQFTIIHAEVKPFGSDFYWEFKVGSFSEFNPYISEYAVLPVRLLNFSATPAANNTVQLKWATATEVNASKFVVQWSATGSGNFSTVGTVAASKNASGSQYTFTHTNPVNGINYYRLQQVDVDGKFSYSGVVAVAVSGGKIKLFPNPAADVITVQLPAGNNYKMITVYDITGRKLLQKTIAAGATQMVIDVHDLVAGVYSVVVSGDGVERVKLLKR